MDENVTVLKENGEIIRPITKEEKKALDSYELPYQVKAFISDLWTAKPKPNVSKKTSKSSIIKLLINVINILLPIVLWSQFLDPNGLFLQAYIGENVLIYIKGVYRLGMFLLWTMVVLSFLYGLLYLGMAAIVKEGHDEMWTPLFLTNFKKKNFIRKNFFFVLSLGIIFGLILNELYFTTVFYIIAIVIVKGSSGSIKAMMKKRIKKEIGVEV